MITRRSQRVVVVLAAASSDSPASLWHRFMHKQTCQAQPRPHHTPLPPLYSVVFLFFGWRKMFIQPAKPAKDVSRDLCWLLRGLRRGGVEWGRPGVEAGQRVVHFGVNAVRDEPQDARLMCVLADFMWVMACRQSWPASCVWLTPCPSPPLCALLSPTSHLPLSRCLHLATPPPFPRGLLLHWLRNQIDRKFNLHIFLHFVKAS